MKTFRSFKNWFDNIERKYEYELEFGLKLLLGFIIWSAIAELLFGLPFFAVLAGFIFVKISYMSLYAISLLFDQFLRPFPSRPFNLIAEDILESPLWRGWLSGAYETFFQSREFLGQAILLPIECVFLFCAFFFWVIFCAFDLILIAAGIAR